MSAHPYNIAGSGFMLKIVYPVCCGIDVHKKNVVATIASTNKRGVTTYQTRSFQTFTKGLRELVAWLAEARCSVVCMESTGKYWIPVYNILEPSCRITLAHPKYVKAIRGKKTDKKDSIWIADLHKHDLVPGSFIPPADIRQLRDLLRYRSKLVSFASSEKTRVQDSLVVSNITLSSVVSDTFGKSASAIIDHLVEHPGNKAFDVRPFLHKSLLGKADQIADSFDGDLSLVQAQKIISCKAHYAQLQSHIRDVESKARELASPYLRHLHIIQSVPGISDLSALAILAEIGPDMSAFHSDKHLCSWAGLAPSNDQSAGKKKSVRISRAGVYIKPLLVQCALAAIKSKAFPFYRLRYQKLKYRRGHKRAIIAIARLLLTAIFHCLKGDVPFDEKRYEARLDASSPQAMRERAVSALFADAKRLGYTLVFSGA